MSIDRYAKRLKNVFVLYVNVFPFVVKDGEPQFLLLKRSDDVVMNGVWQPVSGKMQEGESIKKAFFQQVLKKTKCDSIKVFRSDKVNTYYDDYYDCVMSVPFAACMMSDNNIKIDENLHVEYKWVSLDEFSRLNPFAAHREFAKQIYEYFSGGANLCGFEELRL